MMAGVRRNQRLWLHGLLLLATWVTTTVVGARFAVSFEQNAPAFVLEEDIFFVGRILEEPALLWSGLPFSMTLLAILLAHELGHYIACWYYRIDATLPFFLPAPTLIGTFGAFIRIRGPIYSRRELFDIGVAGPIAGFAFLLPALGIGLALSKVVPGIADQGDLMFGNSALLLLAERIILPGVPSSDIYLHPVARAAWVGLLATALNLLPIGQLDGGHILYSLTSRWHRGLSQAAAFLLIGIGIIFGWLGWILWAGFFLWTGLRHPPIIDETPLESGRLRLAIIAAAILILSFIPVPVRGALQF